MRRRTYLWRSAIPKYAWEPWGFVRNVSSLSVAIEQHLCYVDNWQQLSIGGSEHVSTEQVPTIEIYVGHSSDQSARHCPSVIKKMEKYQKKIILPLSHNQATGKTHSNGNAIEIHVYLRIYCERWFRGKVVEHTFNDYVNRSLGIFYLVTNIRKIVHIPFYRSIFGFRVVFNVWSLLENCASRWKKITELSMRNVEDLARRTL